MPPSKSREAIRLLALVGAIGLAVAAAGYAPAIMACGLGFALLGVRLRGHRHRLKP